MARSGEEREGRREEVETAMEAEGSKFHGAVNRVTDYDVDRLQETTKLDKLKELNLLRRPDPIKLAKISSKHIFFSFPCIFYVNYTCSICIRYKCFIFYYYTYKKLLIHFAILKKLIQHIYILYIS